MNETGFPRGLTRRPPREFPFASSRFPILPSVGGFLAREAARVATTGPLDTSASA